MSRIGKLPIPIPDKTDVIVKDGMVTVKGPKGELSRLFRNEIAIAVENNEIRTSPKDDSTFIKMLWGTYASHLKNMIRGVNEPYERRLMIEGVGYRATVSGKDLVLNIGFSHPVHKPIPDGIEVKVEKNVIIVSGADKEAVGQFAAGTRAAKKPEPYKGKGIRYTDEVVRRKQGKKAA